MAKDNRRQPALQPAEDYYGRPTGPQHQDEPSHQEEPREAPDTPRRAPDDTDEDDVEDSRRAHPMDPTERTPGAILDDIPDGDGPRSDAGTNPLPDHYWTAFPGSLEEEKS